MTSSRSRGGRHDARVPRENAAAATAADVALATSANASAAARLQGAVRRGARPGGHGGRAPPARARPWPRPRPWLAPVRAPPAPLLARVAARAHAAAGSQTSVPASPSR